MGGLYILLALIITLIVIGIKTLYENIKMEKAEPERDMLLKATNLVPYKGIIFIMACFSGLEYLGRDMGVQYIPLTFGISISLLYIVCYHIMRYKKNKQNNEYYSYAKNKNLDFRPGNFFVRPMLLQDGVELEYPHDSTLIKNSGLQLIIGSIGIILFVVIVTSVIQFVTTGTIDFSIYF